MPLSDSDLPWPGFQVLTVISEAPEKPNVAKDILTAFGIACKGAGGGSLNNVDIKRADALASLKASLLETYAKDRSSDLLEVRINEEGEAEFYEVGGNGASVNPYYTISSSTYTQPKVGVSVTGAKPIQERIIYDWHELIGPTSVNSTIHDTTKLITSCLSSLSTHATITYQDVVCNKSSPNWNDGVTDIFELGSPFDRFIGFSWRITPPADLVTHFTKIYQQGQSSVPVLLSDPEASIGKDAKVHASVGTLIRRKQITHVDSTGVCESFDSTVMNCSSFSVPLNLSMNEGLTYETVRESTVSKFLGIQGLFVVGIPLTSCIGVPRDDAAAISENKEDNTVLCVYSPNVFLNVIKLHETIHYITLYTKNDKDFSNLPCFQFANNLRHNDYSLVGTGVTFYIDHNSVELLTFFDGMDPAIGTILPLDTNSGVLVAQVWAQVNLDAPCFIVSDPTGVARDIAENLKVEVLGMVIRDLPSPIAINGKLVDQAAGFVDNDPTTVQDLQETPMETALVAMSSGRTLSLTMASLNALETEILSEKLYALLSEDTGNVHTHTCPPTDESKVGEKGPKGGIINVIEYSYTDQGSYLINVIEGPKYFGDFAGIDGGIYYKQTEEISTKGTIIQDLGNHVQYLVHVDGIGEILCINGCASVLAVRDRVSITIHNNAVEG